MKEMWNARYSAPLYAYGKEPNAFFKLSLDKYHKIGKALFPAEGEGRNAVYAAKQGIDVVAFDISEEGKKKALQLATEEKVEIEYKVGDFLQMDFNEGSFDCAVLIFAHFPPNILSDYHNKIVRLIKPNGIIILEGFSKNHLAYRAENPKVGGPQNEEMLFSEEQITHDFSDFEVLELAEQEVELNEGLYHIGIGKVVRFVGRKRE